uniref:Uncharacterized protein n=1 Tax=Arsenophonus endosymbiont of Trialeurodes vaporariorum TaxID=235567 RepID=A0A3B0MFR0_9GAMM
MHHLHLIISSLIFSGVFIRNNAFFNVGVALIWCLIISTIALSLFHINFLKILDVSEGEVKKRLIEYAKKLTIEQIASNGSTKL